MHHASSFRAIVHGCDVEAGLVLRDDLEEAPLKAWRKATWLSRARFELRTGLDGAGFNVLPLDDERRRSSIFPKKTLRYVALERLTARVERAAAVNLYVDSDLLARLNREMSKGLGGGVQRSARGRRPIGDRESSARGSSSSRGRLDGCRGQAARRA